MNVFDPALRADPFGAYRKLRENGRLHPTGFGIHLVPHYADCAAVLTDPAWGHGYTAGINPFRPGVDPADLPGSFLLLDPPEHGRLRSLVAKAFTPRSVAALRPGITALVDRLLDEALEAGEVDLVAALAFPVPLTTICELLGVPVADHALFGGWTRDISRGLDPDAVLTDAEKAARATAVEEFAAYFTDLIEQRRRAPAGDLLSGLVSAEESGDRLTVKEIVDIGVLLLIAGHETTMNLISSGVLALHRHPDQIAPLLADPATAVEELLRFDTPVPFPTRVAMRDVELAGQELPRGTGVIPLLGSANRDPEVFADPDRLDVRRFAGAAVHRQLAFSHGPHFCLGAPMARLESALTFERLYTRAEVTVITETPEYRPSVSMRGLAALPVSLRRKP
ncbi:cytochrome P450 [Amycolatopsis tucumanensis]|uniref:Cytochrome P450 n=1 Tax=Amycolatopsis tucumanensis TaxID=401106 RepID=A0ABP7HBP5_9PSEU|nr:cytochrome P450 [Amycolatopsis tucumanensis]MCF6421396.1 cytochrome P450 [Amycolatopsis tucumanensis]